MSVLALIFVIVAMVLLVLRAFGVGGRVDLGYLAGACLVTGVLIVPNWNAII